MNQLHTIALAVLAALGVQTSRASAALDYTFAGVADYDNDSYSDIVARDPDGVLWLYPGEGNRAYSGQGRAQIGHGWSSMTFAGVVDHDNDGYQDILARDATGVLWLYPGEGTRAYSTQGRVQIGHGWNGMTFAGVADYDNDSNQDVLVRDTGGSFWLYPGEGTRAYSTQGRTRIGHGWLGMTYAGVADYDNDSSQDSLARDTAGRLWLYPGESTRAYSSQPRAQIGHGW